MANYEFDEVFSENASQEEVYNGACHALVNAFCTGQDVTVLAYGAPHTGACWPWRPAAPALHLRPVVCPCHPQTAHGRRMRASLVAVG
jgi:hypothetical protein